MKQKKEAYIMAENKDRGRERRGSKALNMSAIRILENFRTEHGCDLRTNRSKMLCASCSDYKMCKGLSRERAYIRDKETAAVDSKRRKRRATAQEQKFVKTDTSVEEEETLSYPCEPFEDVCPNQDTCQEGRICPWKKEA